MENREWHTSVWHSFRCHRQHAPKDRGCPRLDSSSWTHWVDPAMPSSVHTVCHLQASINQVRRHALFRKDYSNCWKVTEDVYVYLQYCSLLVLWEQECQWWMLLLQLRAEPPSMQTWQNCILSWRSIFELLVMWEGRNFIYKTAPTKKGFGGWPKGFAIFHWWLSVWYIHWSSLLHFLTEQKYCTRLNNKCTQVDLLFSQHVHHVVILLSSLLR